MLKKSDTQITFSQFTFPKLFRDFSQRRCRKYGNKLSLIAGIPNSVEDDQSIKYYYSRALIKSSLTSGDDGMDE